MKTVFFIIFFLFPFSISAQNQNDLATDIYPFQTAQQHKLFYELLTELRCLVCQNESLADSNAPLAQDLRQQVYQRVLRGETKQSIIFYLTQRYGNFILFKPPFQANTYLIWSAPFLLLLIGLVSLALFLYRRRYS